MRDVGNCLGGKDADALAPKRGNPARRYRGAPKDCAHAADDRRGSMHVGQSHFSARTPRHLTWLAAAVVSLFCTLAGFPLRADVPDPCAGHADGALCNDANPCTRNDICQAGWCKGVVAADGTDCTDGNLCTTADRCVVGLCVGQTVPEGLSCDDGNMCTTGERCLGGSCAPEGNLRCDDSNVCTVDLCFPRQGCVFSPVEPPSQSQCVTPDAGAGGQGGNTGGGGGQGGIGGQGGGIGGEGSEGGTSQPDGGSFDGAVVDAADGPASNGGTGGGSLMSDATAGTADAADALDPIAYQVEGGAILCAMSPAARGRVGVFPWLGLVGMVLVGLRRARSRRR